MKSKYIKTKLQNGGATGQAIGSTIGSVAALAGIPGLSPILGSIGQAVGQKIDLNKALKDHFNSLNQSTNPYGNFEKGGCLECGGMIKKHSHGGVLSGTEDAAIYNGSDHQNGGINVSVKGTPSEAPVAEVEGGEVNYKVNGKSYIFSKKMVVHYNK